MAIEIINVGASPNDGNGDPIRDAFIKCNDNFDELETTKISGSGTDNYVPKFNGPDAIENSQIFDNGTNVGIGTNTPSSTLQVGNGIGIKNIFISGAGSSLALGGLSVSFLGFSSGTISTINTSGSVPLGVGTRSTQPLVLGTNNAEIMRIDSSGNVGIGTTVPATKLDITDVFRVQSSSFSSPSTGIGLELRSVSGTSSLLSYDRTNSLYKPLVLDGSDILIKYSGNNGIYLNSTGNVGIGTTSPSAKFHVSGSGDIVSLVETASNAFAQYQLKSGSTNSWVLGTQSTFLSNALVFRNGSDKMVLTTDGVLGIGLTNPSSSAILHLKSNSKGFLPPTMTTSERNSIGGPENGLVIYNTDSETIDVFTTGGGWKSLSY